VAIFYLSPSEEWMRASIEAAGHTVVAMPTWPKGGDAEDIKRRINERLTK
jgi:hypothetical protein